MDDVGKLERQVTELDQQIQKLQMQKELVLSSISMTKEDDAAFIEHLAKAVDYGYLGNYSFIGPAYGGGLYGLNVDIDKAKHYLQKFYEDYKLCRLKDVSADNIMVALYNLAATESYFCDRDGLTYTTEVIGRMTSLYNEMISIGEVSDRLEEATITDLFNAAIILYSGEFKNTKGEIILFPADIPDGVRGLKVAAMMGNNDAQEFLKSEGI